MRITESPIVYPVIKVSEAEVSEADVIVWLQEEEKKKFIQGERIRNERVSFPFFQRFNDLIIGCRKGTDFFVKNDRNTGNLILASNNSWFCLGQRS